MSKEELLLPGFMYAEQKTGIRILQGYMYLIIAILLYSQRLIVFNSVRLFIIFECLPLISPLVLEQRQLKYGGGWLTGGERNAAG